MIIPLDKLLDYEKNRYHLSLACMFRAVQLMNSPQLLPKKSVNKIAQHSIKHLINEKVNFTTKSEIEEPAQNTEQQNKK